MEITVSTMANHAVSVQDEIVAQMPHAIWRGDRMGTYRTAATPSGFPALDAELPNQGWPRSVLIELLLQQPGSGEMQLLRPALAAIAQRRRIALIQPPHLPHAATWRSWGLPLEHLLWLDTERTADALWAAEQILRNGCCGALVLWQAHVRSAALRRLHLAAQSAETHCWLIRPLAEAQDASPAPLRLGVRPACAGVELTLIKRRGPQNHQAFFLPLASMPAASAATPAATSAATSAPIPPPRHALLDQCAPAAASTRNLATVLV